MTTCLIVDDSKVVRKLARRIVEPFGFEISEAEDGKQALDHCLQTMPDFILLDWHMPVMTGIEFIRALRATAGGDVPKVVFCTTENDYNRILEAIQAGANEYMMKPFDEEILKGKLAQVGIIPS
jgi:two-component system, chemotaxis family, chemotaxis protein CheY